MHTLFKATRKKNSHRCKFVAPFIDLDTPLMGGHPISSVNLYRDVLIISTPDERLHGAKGVVSQQGFLCISDHI